MNIWHDSMTHDALAKYSEHDLEDRVSTKQSAVNEAIVLNDLKLYLRASLELKEWQEYMKFRRNALEGRDYVRLVKYDANVTELLNAYNQ